MQIRTMQPGDIPACAEILCSVYNNEVWQCRWAQDTAAAYLTDITRMPRFLGYVAEEEGAVLGAIFARENIWWNNSEVYVEEMFIRPELQRQGLGGRLIQRVEDDAHSRGLAGITLSTNRHAPAAQFYRKHGFANCEHVFFLAKEIHDDHECEANHR